MQILHYPDSRLSQSAIEVSLPISPDIKAALNKMFDLMVERRGIGIAAPQVGLNLRMFIMKHRGEYLDVINPIITPITEETCQFKERCLSIPGTEVETTRFSSINMICYNIFGEQEEYELSGLSAIVAQHEMDHLNGKLMIDGLSKLKLDRIKTKIKKEIKMMSPTDI